MKAQMGLDILISVGLFLLALAVVFAAMTLSPPAAGIIEKSGTAAEIIS